MKIEEIIKTYKTTAKVSAHLANKSAKITTPTGGSYSGHNLPEDSVIKIIRCNGSLQSPYFGSFSCITPTGTRTIYGCEMKFDADTVESIQEEITVLLDSIEKTEAEIKELQTKLVFMKDNNLKTFDETDFKVYAVLAQLEDATLTKVQRAQAIAKLVKG